MKVMILNYEFPPLGGGAASASCNIADELGRLGHEVTVVTSGYKDNTGIEKMGRVEIHRVRSYRTGIQDCGIKGAFAYLLFAMIPIISSLKKKKFDVIHYFFSLPTGLLSLVPGHHQLVPYIISLRGSDVPYYDPSDKKLHFFHRVLTPINKRIWSGADKVIANSDALRRIALRTYPSLKIGVIGNGVDREVFRPAEFYPDSGNPTQLFCVSRLIKRKGIESLLLALSEIDKNQVRLVVVGTGSEEKNLKRMSNQLGLDAVVKFMGYVPREELPPLYRQAHVFVLPTLSESFSVAFAEALACGLPIISTRVGAIPELVEDGTNGFLVRPGDVSALREAIEKLITDPVLRRHMSRNSREKSKKLLSWREVAILYLNEYNSVLKASALL